jgi:type IX secretion system PorP/SprF family membrane protein
MNHAMKKILLSLAVLCLCADVFSQQLTNFSLYRDNSFLANPAIAGSERAPILAATYRNQWRKIEGAPNTAAVSYRGRIGKSPHGIGGIVMNDQTGPTSFTSATFAYAFHLDFYKINPFYWSKFLRNSKLSFGLSASVFQYRLRASMLQLDDPNDQAVAQANTSRFLPNAGAGIYYYYDNFYVGFSVPQLIPLKAKFESGDGTSTIQREMHYYTVVGGKISFKKGTHNIEPIGWFKTVKGAPFQYDIHLRYRYKEVWWAGVAYRSSMTAVIEAGFMIRKRFQIGYAFDQNISRLAKFTAGSHEIILAYHFIKNKYGRYR